LAFSCQAPLGCPAIYGTVYSKFSVFCRALILCCTLSSVAALAETPPEPAFQLFMQSRPDTFLRELRLRSPAPVSPETRNEIPRALPKQGELKNLDAAERSKLSSLLGILEVHDRASVYIVKVITVPEAILALHARCILLISESGLAIWSAAELQALAAHEIGHEYVWDKYYAARAGNNREELQRLELYCDGISILTLSAAGVDPSNLTSAVEKGIMYNRAHLGVARNETSYPNFSRRASFHKMVIQWIAKSQAESETAH
jgi:hypothetical protein